MNVDEMNPKETSMMKKCLSAILVFMVLAAIIAGCGANGTAGQGGPGDSSSSGPAAEGSGSQGQADRLRIALLLPGLLGDKSFFDACNAAAPMLEAELGAETKVVEMGADQTKWYPTFKDYCEQDYDLILTVSAPIMDVLTEIAAEYPDQKFMNVACGAEIVVPENVYVMESDMGEMGYLAGVVAALKARELGESKIGFIGGMDIPDINQFLIGYIDGARYINSDIKVVYSFVGDFADPSKAKETALVMYADVPVIYQAAGGSGLGVFSAAKELTQKGKPRFAIGVDSDQAMELKDSDPEAANLILTSTIKRISEGALNAVARYIQNEVKWGIQDRNGLKDGAISIAKNEFYEKLLSPEDRQLVDEVEAKLVSGEIAPQKNKGLSTQEIAAIRDGARP
jgi:basic membrane protein A